MLNAWLNRHIVIKRVISGGALFAFFSWSVVADARATVNISDVSHELPLQEHVRFAHLDTDTFTVPEHLGEVKYSFKGDPDKVVVHIQDAHCNCFAQHKIADIIDYLNKEYGIRLVNLEGGAGDYDLTVFTSITGEAIRREVADYFLKKGEINGAEFYAVNNPGKVVLWGIEDKDLYLANLNVYRKSLAYKTEVDKYLKELTHILNNLKRHIYTPELLKVDMAYSAYKAGNDDLRGYLEFLVQTAKESGIQVKRFSNLYLLTQAMSQEQEIDFKKANMERNILIDELKSGLSRNEVRELVSKSVSFKTKRITRKAFYGYLLDKARELGIDIGRFPELSNYIVYMTTYEAVDRSRVMEETDGLEVEIREPLYRNDTERRLNTLSRNLALLKNIFDITLTRTDYKYYLGGKDSFDVNNFVNFIEEQAPRYRIDVRPDANIGMLDDYRGEITKFYEYSFERDKVFLKNLRFGSMAENVKSTILMTGGFHAENLGSLFEEAGISYVSILPKFTSAESYQSPYFGLLAGQTTDVQRMLSSVLAKASIMAIASKLNPILGAAIYGDKGMNSFEAAVFVLRRLGEEKGPDAIKNIDDMEITEDGGFVVCHASGWRVNIPKGEILIAAGLETPVKEDELRQVAAQPAAIPPGAIAGQRGFAEKTHQDRVRDYALKIVETADAEIIKEMRDALGDGSLHVTRLEGYRKFFESLPESLKMPSDIKVEEVVTILTSTDRGREVEAYNRFLQRSSAIQAGGFAGEGVEADLIGKLFGRDGKLLTDGFTTMEIENNILRIIHPSMDPVDIRMVTDEHGAVITRDAREVAESLEGFVENRKGRHSLTEQEEKALFKDLKNKMGKVKKVVALQHHENVNGAFGKNIEKEDVLYLYEGLMDRDNPLSLMGLIHELGEGGFIGLPEGRFEGTGITELDGKEYEEVLTRHTYMRGVGEKVRSAYDALVREIGEDVDDLSLREFISELEKKMDGLNLRPGTGNRLTVSEKALLALNFGQRQQRENPLEGPVSRIDLEGIQGKLDLTGNYEFTSQIKFLKEDFRRGALNIHIIPGYNFETRPLQEDYGRRDAREFRKMGINTRVSHFDGLEDLRKWLEKAAAEMEKNWRKNPEAFVLCLTGKEAEAVTDFKAELDAKGFKQLADRFVIGKDVYASRKEAANAQIPEIKTLEVATLILNNKRLIDSPGKSSDDPDLMESTRNLLAFLGYHGFIDLIEDMGNKSGAQLADIMRALFNGVISLRITRVNWKEIDAYRSSMEEVGRSL